MSEAYPHLILDNFSTQVLNTVILICLIKSIYLYVSCKQLIICSHALSLSW
uniref:Uncharacterized protein n=1 Tax=Arundo donax TaxID=35708 RepID=A0A0A9HP29_ARUDO